MTVPHKMASSSPTSVQQINFEFVPNPSGASSTTSTSPSSTSGASRTAKTKPRTNAARRASHNAVERLRREALNSRFLECASMLPNLATIKRPTKSSVVNSCIAHLHASRRHRLLAAQQVRILSDECESLRREANEWRERAGLMLLPPPVRGEAFEIVLVGAEFELESPDPPSGEGEEEDYVDEESGGGGRYSQEDLARIQAYHHQQQQQQMQHQIQMQYGAQPEVHPGHFHSPFAHNIPSPMTEHHVSQYSAAHSWYDDNHPHPRSAHEPFMTHPYISRLQQPPPQVPRATIAPLFVPSVQPPEHLDFVPPPRPDQPQLSPLFPPGEYSYDPLAGHQLPPVHGAGHVIVHDTGASSQLESHPPSTQFDSRSHDHLRPGPQVHRASRKGTR
ncbi:macrophage erythroblast attacher [Favolaschia claudopus]|uniref:Macrophage erythroblast attacher n=1 Tax=Favolaschia claudopus TaxID=2862362 RepID=A0AAW0E5J8_9AGAR